MNMVHRIETWGDTHHPKFVDLIRIALGVFLFWKGLSFFQDIEYLKELIIAQNFVELSAGLLTALVYYVVFAHMVGGVLIGLGVLTRFGCIIQIPIVLGAVFMTGFFQDPVTALAWPSILALIALVMFLILGSGPWSLDRYFNEQ